MNEAVGADVLWSLSSEPFIGIDRRLFERQLHEAGHYAVEVWTPRSLPGTELSLRCSLVVRDATGRLLKGGGRGGKEHAATRSGPPQRGSATGVPVKHGPDARTGDIFSKSIGRHVSASKGQPSTSSAAAISSSTTALNHAGTRGDASDVSHVSPRVSSASSSAPAPGLHMSSSTSRLRDGGAPPHRAGEFPGAQGPTTGLGTLRRRPLSAGDTAALDPGGQGGISSGSLAGLTVQQRRRMARHAQVMAGAREGGGRRRPHSARAASESPDPPREASRESSFIQADVSDSDDNDEDEEGTAATPPNAAMLSTALGAGRKRAPVYPRAEDYFIPLARPGRHGAESGAAGQRADGGAGMPVDIMAGDVPRSRDGFDVAVESGRAATSGAGRGNGGGEQWGEAEDEAEAGGDGEEEWGGDVGARASGYGRPVSWASDQVVDVPRWQEELVVTRECLPVTLEIRMENLARVGVLRVSARLSWLPAPSVTGRGGSDADGSRMGAQCSPRLVWRASELFVRGHRRGYEIEVAPGSYLVCVDAAGKKGTSSSTLTCECAVRGADGSLLHRASSEQDEEAGGEGGVPAAAATVLWFNCFDVPQHYGPARVELWVLSRARVGLVRVTASVHSVPPGTLATTTAAAVASAARAADDQGMPRGGTSGDVGHPMPHNAAARNKDDQEAPSPSGAVSYTPALTLVTGATDHVDLTATAVTGSSPASVPDDDKQGPLIKSGPSHAKPTTAAATGSFVGPSRELPRRPAPKPSSSPMDAAADVEPPPGSRPGSAVIPLDSNMAGKAAPSIPQGTDTAPSFPSPSPLACLARHGGAGSPRPPESSTSLTSARLGLGASTAMVADKAEATAGGASTAPAGTPSPSRTRPGSGKGFRQQVDTAASNSDQAVLSLHAACRDHALGSAGAVQGNDRDWSSSAGNNEVVASRQAWQRSGTQLTDSLVGRPGTLHEAVPVPPSPPLRAPTQREPSPRTRGRVAGIIRVTSAGASPRSSLGRPLSASVMATDADGGAPETRTSGNGS